MVSGDCDRLCVSLPTRGDLEPPSGRGLPISALERLCAEVKLGYGEGPLP